MQLISLRNVSKEDLPTFFKNQADPQSNLMAAFPARNEEAFLTHWKNRILENENSAKQTIVFDGQVAGNIICFKRGDRRFVGYWIGREFWGKGIASTALREFLKQTGERPLYALVASHNVASRKVLEKCGFEFVSSEMIFSKVHGHEIEETLLVCR